MNLWAILRKRKSTGVSVDRLRAVRLSLRQRVKRVQRDGGIVEFLGPGVVVSINGVETTDLERLVRVDAPFTVDDPPRSL